VIYKDNISAICRRWNWKEADRTKFTETTVNGFLVTEGLLPVDRSLISAAINELALLIESFCGGTLTRGILDVSNSEMTLQDGE